MNVALCPEHVNILSICTGGGGLDLGVELAVPGARSVCMVEREAFAVAQLVSAMEAGLMAPAPIWSDARTFDGRAWRGTVDGLIGGIPCQPHSLAGRKQGQNDARDLWSTARRIIVQSRAWFVVIENVGGMLAAGSDEIAGAQRVFRDLSKLGFEVEGGLFTAAEVGPPHRRERIIILGVADPQSIGRGSGVLPIRNEQEVTRSESNDDRLADAFGLGLGRKGNGSFSSEFTTEAGGAVVHPIGGRRPQGRDDNREYERPELGAAVKHALGNANGVGKLKQNNEDGSEPWQNPRRSFGRAGGEFVTELADASIARGWSVPVQQGRQDEAGGYFDRPGLFPPGPGDAEIWRIVAEHAAGLLPAVSRHDRFLLEIGKARAAAYGDSAGGQGLDPQGPFGLRSSVVSKIAQSTLRRMADGVASRVDELRMLGNGVVSLEAAYALRTLATRLAARGSAGAARLVRMMEIAA